MNPVDRLFFVATDWLYMHETASKLLGMSGLDKLASLPYRTLKKRRLIRRYGPSFERDFTGELTVNGATFRLQDPWLHYLPMAMAGFDYEPAVTRHLKQVIGNRRLCFLDVGAFMGYYTAYVGTLNRKCEIHSFEPNTDFYKILDNNVKLNRINAKLHKVALSDETGEIPFAGRSMNLEDGYEVETVASVPFDALRDEITLIARPSLFFSKGR